MMEVIVGGALLITWLAYILHTEDRRQKAMSQPWEKDLVNRLLANGLVVSEENNRIIFSNIKIPQGDEHMALNLNDVYKEAHDKTGGEKKIDAGQHAESCAALLDVLAGKKPSEVLAALEERA